MKKITLITLLVFCISSLLIAEEISLKEKMKLAKKDWEGFNYKVYISPLIIPDVGFGICNSSKKGNFYHESTFYLHGLYYIFGEDKDYFARFGMKLKNSYFLKNDRSGFNFFFILGVEKIYYDLPLDPGGSSGYNPEWHTFPDLAIGCGYSWKLNNDNYIRVSADVGIKAVLGNIYLSYVW